MTRLIFLLFMAFAGMTPPAQPPALVISHLIDDLYIYTTYRELNGYRFPSNSLYLVTDTGVVMFDTPWDTTQCQPLFDSIALRHNKNVILAIVTHYHDDRTAGLEFLRFKGIPTYGSKLTAELCRRHGEKEPGFIFTKDTFFRAGNYTFETFYPGPGHSPDNIVIWFENGVLYGGCLVKSTDARDLGNMADADPAEWRRSIRNLMKKYPDPAYIIPGHFGWQNRHSVKHTLELLNHALR